MDQGSLVIDQINAGAEFVNRLDKQVRVRAAFWLRAADQRQWYLYVASDQITDRTRKAAYAEISQVARAMSNPNLDVFQIRLLGLSHPLAQAALGVHNRFAARVPLHDKDRLFGDVYVDEVYVYPPPYGSAAEKLPSVEGPMTAEAVYGNLMILGEGFEACAEKHLQLPSLIVLYSAIDITAWLANDDTNAGVDKRYTAWVDQYLLKAKPLPCNSADLYAARCGTLHTLTADSDMNAKGKARQIAYAWGDRSAADLQRLSVALGMDKAYVVVQIEELYDGWKRGVQDFTEELKNDPIRAARVYARAARFFDTSSTETIDQIIQKAKSPGGHLSQLVMP
jgi:hypothetical protein